MSRDTPFLLSIFKKSPDEVLVTGTSLPDVTEETGWDRLRRMFSIDKYGYRSKQVNMIGHQVMTVTLAGGVFGAIVHSRDTYISFFENNQATKFASHFEAKRELSRVMYLSFAKGAFRWGWRIGSFSFTFLSIMTMTSVYYDHESVLDFLVAGGLTGGLFKAHLGMKGIVAGSVVGATLGGIAGSLSLMALRLFGKSMTELQDFSKEFTQSRENLIKKNQKAYLIREATDFTDGELKDENFKNLDVDGV